MIAPIVPVNTMTLNFTQAFSCDPATPMNLPTRFEGQHIGLLESYREEPVTPESYLWGPACEEMTTEDNNNGGVADEIKA